MSLLLLTFWRTPIVFQEKFKTFSARVPFQRKGYEKRYLVGFKRLEGII